MSLKDLFFSGISFEEFFASSEKEYQEKINNMINNIKIDDDLKVRINNVNEKIYIAAFVNSWCLDSQINLSGLYTMIRENKNINLRILKREGNEKYIEKYNCNGKPRTPTFLILDEDFCEMGSFVEVPSVVRDILSRGNETEILICKRKYKKGEYIKDTIQDVLNIIV